MAADEYASWPDEPVTLVEVREGPTEGPGGWSLRANEAALALLRRIDARICVVGVVGPYRSGKSSLLNWLRAPGGGAGGFAVGHGVDRCTRGIVLAGRPTAIALNDGSSAALLFLVRRARGIPVGARAETSSSVGHGGPRRPRRRRRVRRDALRPRRAPLVDARVRFFARPGFFAKGSGMNEFY